MSDHATCQHYARQHGRISQEWTIQDIHRDIHPEQCPGLDFNNQFGLWLTRGNVLLNSTNPTLAAFVDQYHKTPTLISYNIRDIRDGYRRAFFEFFHADPLSLHAHVTDAANPMLIASIIRQLGMFARAAPEFAKVLIPGEAVRVAVMENSYGGGYGPLAYNAVCEDSPLVATGEKPVVVRMEPGTIAQQIGMAKNNKCVAFYVEMVRSSDGCPMSSKQWQATVEACKEHNMILIVDEALTAIRCGAPFAHQLSQYQRHGRPDLILFGKGIHTSGVAVDWEGINMRSVGITSLANRARAMNEWQKRFTEAAPAASLLQSWGTIHAAQTQGWPNLAIRIGRTLRKLFLEMGFKRSSFSGLHAFIWLRRDDPACRDLLVMVATAGSEWVRLLPTMDPVMASAVQLKSNSFGPASKGYRGELATYLAKKRWRLGYCSSCGEEIETRDDCGGYRKPCMKCLARPCKICEPGAHVCRLEGKVN